MSALHITLHALGAQHSAVERKFFPRLETDDLVIPDFELNSALLAAETTVRLNQLLRGVLRFTLPSAGWFVIQMRSVSSGQLRIIDRRPCHEIPFLRLRAIALA